jgi:alpha-tubulin suppressor-like RCC1 family protein
VISGGNFSLCAVDDGFCYGWGYNNEGQLKMSDGEAVIKPKIVNLIGNVRYMRNIVAGFHHSHSLTKAGVAVTVGYNNFGQLGMGDNDDRNRIAEIPDFRNRKVVFIGVGENHSFALVN